MEKKILGLCASLVLVGPTLAGPPDLVFDEEIIDPVAAGDCKAVGDIDGDGRLDLLLGGRPGEDLAWYAWPHWQRTVIARAVEEFTTDMAVGDIDGDGDPDVVVGDGGTGTNLHWYRNPRPAGNPADGGAWQRLAIGSATDYVKDVELADFNLDGRLDVAVRTHGVVWIFFNNGGSWSRVQIRNGLTGEGMGSGDIDGDGDTDLLLPGMWLENPEPAADAATSAWAVRTIDGSLYQEVKALVADIDGDGAAEVVFSPSEGSGAVRWYKPTSGNPRGLWTGRTVIQNLPGCHTLQAGDIDHDGDIDLVVAQMHTHGGQIFVVLNNGGGMSWTQVPIGSGGIHNGVLADIDADGDLDLYGANWTTNPPVRLWRNAGQPCPEDFNNDGAVNSSDISVFLTTWIIDASSGGTATDWNRDGEINSSDISMYLGAWISAVDDGCQ